jgi:hypothetical protein
MDPLKRFLGSLAMVAASIAVSVPASAQQPQKPNIVVIMGDDIGMWNIGASEKLWTAPPTAGRGRDICPLANAF